MNISRNKHYGTIAVTTIIIALILAITSLLFLDNSESINNQVPDSKQPLTPSPEATPGSTTTDLSATGTEENLSEYIEVTDGCGVHFSDDCLLVRSGPGKEFPVVGRLRTGIVLKINESIEKDGLLWYKISFDEWLRYPERLESDWYVAAPYVQLIKDEGTITTWDNDYATGTDKRIVVSRSKQLLSAYDGDVLFMETSISTGLELTPTPRGTFTVFKMTPSRYMQGPLPGLADQQVYDLPGVPWNLYFTEGGAVIHGTYWHESFGQPYSHGCVNVLPADAKKLYYWADLGTQVQIKD